MSTRDVLIADIEKFLERSGMTATAFGQQCLNDAKLLHGLRHGRDIRTRQLDKIRAFMRSYKSKSKPEDEHRAV
jgi:predicted transcriptional regulator